jgi:hypothetical protein
VVRVDLAGSVLLPPLLPVLQQGALVALVLQPLLQVEDLAGLALLLVLLREVLVLLLAVRVDLALPPVRVDSVLLADLASPVLPLPQEALA